MHQKTISTFIITLLWVPALLAVGGWARADQSAATPPGKKGPRISVENNVHDFGEIVQGEKVGAAFTFQNTGDETLKIERLVSDHNRVTAKASDTALGPGQEGAIEVSLDATRLRGHVAAEISLFTNDKVQPRVSLHVGGHVVPFLSLKPPFLFAGQIKKDASYSGKVRVSGKLVEEGKADALEIKASSPSIAAEITGRDAKSGALILEVVILPDMKPGSFKEFIALESKDPPGRAQLLLFGQKLGDIQFSPEKLVFFAEKGKDDDFRAVTFECDKPFRITQVKEPSGQLNVSIQSEEEGRKYTLIAKLKTPPKGAFLGVIEVHTDRADQPLIQIPFIGGKVSPEVKNLFQGVTPQSGNPFQQGVRGK